MADEVEPGVLNQLSHPGRGMHKRAKGGPALPHRVLESDACSDVPAISGIRECKPACGVRQRRGQQPLVERVAADHAVEGHYARCRDTLGDVEKVAEHELDIWRSFAPGGFVRRCG